jgi:hypothetical protein
VLVELPTAPQQVMEGSDQLWYNVHQPPAIGLAAPVADLLNTLGNT